MVRFHLYTWWNLAYLNQTLCLHGLPAHLYGLEKLTCLIVQRLYLSLVLLLVVSSGSIRLSQ